jgi:hypothetical protein
VALLGLSACGGSGSASGSAAAGASAAKAVGAASAGAGASASSSPAGTSGAKAGTSSGTSSGSRARATTATQLALRVTSAARAKQTAHLAMSGPTQDATGAIRYTSSGVDIAMTAALPGGKKMQMVIIRSTAYMNVGEPYQGKNWIRIAPGGSDPLSKVLGPLLAKLGSGLDLDKQLAGVKGSTITAATRTDLGGVPATKYTLVSSESALMAQLDTFASTPALRDTLRAQFKGAHGESVMWVSDEGLPLRVDSRVVGGKAPQSTTTVTYSDWGKPVSIAAPPASDTVNAG